MKRLFDEHIIRACTELSGTWNFLTDPADIGIAEGWQRGLPEGESVIVPSVWNNEIGLLNYDGAAWYEKRFYTEGGTLRFVFESVMTEAKVWLDGVKLGEHYGAFSQFEFTVCDVSAGEHLLTVCADSRFNELSIPQKRVDWFNYGGIARDVSVERLIGICTLSSHIEYTLSDDLKSAEIRAVLKLYNADGAEKSSPVSVSIGDTVIYSAPLTLGARESLTLTTPYFKMDDISLWDIKNPALYTVNIKTDTDDLIDRIGFRKIEARDNKILLNGRAIELRGVNRHDEHPDWGFAFPPKMMKRDLDIITDLGCNTIRGSHYPNSRIFIDMLDERGILFWSEIPIWGGGFPDTVLNNPKLVERGLMMHREMTEYYYNHPSIIIWGMHNEIYTPYPCVEPITKLYAKWLRENGGNRLITHAANQYFEDSSMEYDDIICLNAYFGWYGESVSHWDKFVEDFKKHAREKGWGDKPIIMSEFGAGALYGCHNYFDTQRWSEEYQADLLKHCLELFHKDSMISGFYIWQFANIRTSPSLDLNRVRCFNNKGILDEYRNPKNAYFTVKKLYKRFASEDGYDE